MPPDSNLESFEKIFGEMALPLDVADAWEVMRTAKYIQKGVFKTVALQFPDELLQVSPSILEALSRECTGSRFYILGDSTFGSCCVDEVAAAHVRADLIVHYGHACLSPTSTTSAFYVFGMRSLDAHACAIALGRHLRAGASDVESCTLLLWDPNCTHGVAAILASVAAELDQPEDVQAAAGNVHGCCAISWRVPACTPQLVVPTLQLETRVAQAGESLVLAADGEMVVCGFHTGLVEPDGTDVLIDTVRNHPLRKVTAGKLHVVYLGDRTARARLLVGRFATERVTCIDPASGQSEELTSRGARLMSTRYRAVEVVRGAGSVGIVAGTLGVAHHRALLRKLRAVITGAGKGCYTLLVGKPSPVKLGNFPDIDAFVVVSCPESCIPSEEESRNYPAPLVTPHEALIALSDGDCGISWTGRAIVDIAPLVATGLDEGNRNGNSRVGGLGRRGSEVGPTLSLVTGRLIAPRVWQGEAPDRGAEDDEGAHTGTSTTLIKQEGPSALMVAGAHSTAAEYLATRREWRGLQYEAPDAPGSAVVHVGTSGLARGYTTEPK